MRGIYIFALNLKIPFMRVKAIIDMNALHLKNNETLEKIKFIRKEIFDFKF